MAAHLIRHLKKHILPESRMRKQVIHARTVLAQGDDLCLAYSGFPKWQNSQGLLTGPHFRPMF